MSWVRLDDQFFRHPKALEAGKDGRLLFLAGLCWCSNQLTDGRIPKAAVPVLAAEAEVKQAVVAVLVRVGLWEDHGDAYHVHDYEEYQRSRAEAEMLSEKRAAAGRKGGQSSSKVRSKPQANAQARGSNHEAQSHLPPSSSNSSSSSGTVVGGDDDDTFAAALTIPAVVDAACELLAYQDLEARMSNPALPPIGNQERYLAACKAARHTDLGPKLYTLAARNPEWTPEQLADVAIRPPDIAPRSVDTLGIARQHGLNVATPDGDPEDHHPRWPDPDCWRAFLEGWTDGGGRNPSEGAA